MLADNSSSYISNDFNMKMILFLGVTNKCCYNVYQSNVNSGFLLTPTRYPSNDLFIGRKAHTAYLVEYGLSIMR